MKYLRRIVWFFASRLLVLCLILGLIITVFYYAMNVSNIQIVLKDGMANRAKYVMGMENSRKELEKYFQPVCLESDSAVLQSDEGNSPYADYNVRGIDHRLEMGFVWVWPRLGSRNETRTVTVEVTENIPGIDGRVRSDRAEEIVLQDLIYS